MGNKNEKATTEVQTMVFDVFSTLKWLERIWRVFCFRFEYKYYRTDTNKFTITWEEFEGTFLDEFNVDPDSEGIDLDQFLIYHTFKKIFEYNKYEIRVYRVYMFFFPYCLHLNGAEGLNFIDLLFEKIIYNLEVEMVNSLQEAKNLNIAESDSDSDEENDKFKYGNEADKKSKKSKNMQMDKSQPKKNLSEKGKNENENDLISKVSKANAPLSNIAKDDFKSNRNDENNNINDENLGIADSSRKMINKDIASSRRKNRVQSAAVIEKQITGSTLETNLLRKYQKEFNNQKQNGFIRKISFEVFKEIMFVYFQNNIVQFIKAFKEVLTNFKDYEYVDDNLVDAIKAIDKEKIDLRLFTSKNIQKFLNNTYEKKLFGVRNNIKRDPHSDFNTLLTFDDIYVYMKNNFYFYNSKRLYFQFKRDISI